MNALRIFCISNHSCWEEINDKLKSCNHFYQGIQFIDFHALIDLEYTFTLAYIFHQSYGLMHSKSFLQTLFRFDISFHRDYFVTLHKTFTSYYIRYLTKKKKEKRENERRINIYLIQKWIYYFKSRSLTIYREFYAKKITIINLKKNVVTSVLIQIDMMQIHGGAHIHTLTYKSYTADQLNAKKD